MIAAALERAQIAPVLPADEIGHVATGLVPGVLDRLNGTRRPDRQRGRLAREPFVDEHRDLLGAIDHHQRYVIHEMGFPQLRCNPHVVRAIARNELIAANLHPILGLRDAGSILRVDPQPERRSPQKICHEPHPVSIVGKDPRARSLEPLLCDDRSIDGWIELGLGHAVRPDDARHIDARARA